MTNRQKSDIDSQEQFLTARSLISKTVSGLRLDQKKRIGPGFLSR